MNRRARWWILVAALLPLVAVARAAPNAVPPTRSASPLTILIVPGAWGGAWDWKHVGELLEAQGDRVYRLTLTGLGERAHLAGPSVTLTTHIDDVVNVIEYEDLHSVVLVGHSYAGMVLAGVCDRIPDRIDRAIYLDAGLPDDGQTFLDVRGSGKPAVPEQDGLLIPSWLDRNHPPPFYVPQPARTWTEPIRLRNPAAPRVRSIYVLFAPAEMPVEQAEEYASYAKAAARGWTVQRFASDHMAHRSHPDELARLLQSLATPDPVGANDAVDARACPGQSADP